MPLKRSAYLRLRVQPKSQLPVRMPRSRLGAVVGWIGLEGVVALILGRHSGRTLNHDANERMHEFVGIICDQPRGDREYAAGTYATDPRGTS